MNDNLGHEFGITSLASNTNLLLSSDTSGLMLVWNARSLSTINTIRSVDESGITSSALWNNCIVASYANGMIRFFDPENGRRTIVHSFAQLNCVLSTHLRLDRCSCSMYQCHRLQRARSASLSWRRLFCSPMEIVWRCRKSSSRCSFGSLSLERVSHRWPRLDRSSMQLSNGKSAAGGSQVYTPISFRYRHCILRFE